MEIYDVVIIGAGAAGLMCAAEAGKRGRRVLLLDKAKAVGEKIRISGGGRCNFTNLHATPKNYLSNNPRFCVSALKRYTPADFMALVEKHHIAYHEKTLGQLFCDGSSKQIIAMLLAECAAGKVDIMLQQQVQHIAQQQGGFIVALQGGGLLQTTSLVVATGGPSIPKMGATGWGYSLAEQFGLHVVPPRAGLVPFTLQEALLAQTRELAGIAVDVRVQCNGQMFEEAMLFTHRGLSGPAILQISSYWKPGDAVQIDMLPGKDMFALLKAQQQSGPKQMLGNVLAHYFPKKLAQFLVVHHGLEGRLADLSHKKLQQMADAVHRWRIFPNGTEGYRTAEVTLGGVDVAGISSKTFETNTVPGLYFIGEVLDVTGHLGGFNFQWAWASGFAAGQFV